MATSPMGRKVLHLWLLLASLTCAIIFANGDVVQDDREEYIVYMGDPPKGRLLPSANHVNMLQKVVSSINAPTALVRSYKRSFNAFAAKLTPEEAQRLSSLSSVVSMFPNKKKHLHTTRSWDFIGFPQQVQRSPLESDVIVAILDTGIWPESASFNDTGYGPPPIKWRGTCQTSLNFTCNNKIIGAQAYRSVGLYGPDDDPSPRDTAGHGTHTASTVAGGLVNMASFMGLGLGTARGGIPSARIAVYKVCWSDGCYDDDILAAFDDAIADGVDIISISLGGSTALNYFNDSLAIGAFHAMKQGILTSTSAGNDGPAFSTITNFSPWVLSVAASTTDRKYVTKVQLGNNMVYEGISINTFDMRNQMFPLIYGGDAPNKTGGISGVTSRFCMGNSLDQNLVKGKIVLCDVEDPGKAPLQAGAAGFLMRDQAPKDSPHIYPLPASYLSAENGGSIFLYMNSTSNGSATILKSEEGIDSLAPYVPSFSSRGPNPGTPNILKPDLTAPGVSILAAWSPTSPPSEVKGDTRSVPYNMMTGTSMACPHATAAAAYVKSFHPTWSPAAIKSALMTTASPMNSTLNMEAELAYGAGLINPIRALNPGLVYDAGVADFVNFLCGQGYATGPLQLVTGDDSVCSIASNATVLDLNYPTFALSVNKFENISNTFRRTVTNVGAPNSIYVATVTGVPSGLNIQVEPNTLSFTSVSQKLSFALIIEGTISQSVVSASLVWNDGVRQARSPIVVYSAT